MSDDMNHPDAGLPPVEPDFDAMAADEPAETKWPSVLGVLALIYACGGLLCQVFAMVSPFMTDFWASLAGVDIDIEMPPMLIYLPIALGVITFFLGLLLLFGAVNLLRRRRSGPRMIRQWVFARIIMIVVGLGAQVVLLPASVDVQYEMGEAMKQAMIDNGNTPPPGAFPSKEQIRQRAVIGTGVFSVVMAIFPVFMGVWLSRRRIREEVETWE